MIEKIKPLLACISLPVLITYITRVEPEKDKGIREFYIIIMVIVVIIFSIICFPIFLKM